MWDATDVCCSQKSRDTICNFDYVLIIASYIFWTTFNFIPIQKQDLFEIQCYDMNVFRTVIILFILCRIVCGGGGGRVMMWFVLIGISVFINELNCIKIIYWLLFCFLWLWAANKHSLFWCVVVYRYYHHHHSWNDSHREVSRHIPCPNEADLSFHIYVISCCMPTHY